MKKSHFRNRIKRLLRESYRLNKPDFVKKYINSNITLNILFTLSSTGYTHYQDLQFEDINARMKELLININSIVTGK
ncbi:MAG: ribonuclease P protein component [Ignavibacteria bacterium]